VVTAAAVLELLLGEIEQILGVGYGGEHLRERLGILLAE